MAPPTPSLALASDHAGRALKRALIERLRAAGHALRDFGPDDDRSVDYPDFAAPVAQAVVRGEHTFGLLICGTGIGMCMVANKVPGVRAAHCRTEYEARMTRAHNDANVLCLGERVTGPGLAWAIVEAFLATPFEGGRHTRRVEKIMALEGSMKE